MSLNSCAHRQPIVMLLRSAGLLPLPRCCGPARKDGRDRRLSPAGWMRALLLLLPRDHCKAQGEGGEGSPTAASCPIPDGCFSVLFLTPVSKHPPPPPVRTPRRVWVFRCGSPKHPSPRLSCRPLTLCGNIFTLEHHETTSASCRPLPGAQQRRDAPAETSAQPLPSRLPTPLAGHLRGQPCLGAQPRKPPGLPSSHR